MSNVDTIDREKLDKRVIWMLISELYIPDLLQSWMTILFFWISCAAGQESYGFDKARSFIVN